jgi:Tfp pilus assembly protein PilO
VASPVEAPKLPKSNIAQRLPRLSTSVWLILILALFLIAMVPLVTGYIEQVSQQAAMQLQINQVQSQIDALKAKMASQSSATTDAAKMKKELDDAKLQYKNVGDNAEVSQIIMGLAWDYDITITSMSVSQAMSKASGTEYPVLTYSLSLTGQVANFQNFLIAVGKKLPSSQFTGITISPATVEGELDNATISMQVYCNN